MSALVSVPFHGDVLEAVKDEAGTIWVSSRRVCENLGVDFARQSQKLSRKGWAVVGIMPTTGADGKTYMMQVIDLESLPMWLATIDSRRVAESVRAKLEKYQREAKRVLASHFLPPVIRPGLTHELSIPDSVLAAPAQIATLEFQQSVLFAAVEKLIDLQRDGEKATAELAAKLEQSNNETRQRFGWTERSMASVFQFAGGRIAPGAVLGYDTA